MWSVVLAGSVIDFLHTVSITASFDEQFTSPDEHRGEARGITNQKEEDKHEEEHHRLYGMAWILARLTKGL